MKEDFMTTTMSLEHVKQALKVAKKGGKKYNGYSCEVRYDQNKWTTSVCETACCLWGMRI